MTIYFYCPSCWIMETQQQRHRCALPGAARPHSRYMCSTRNSTIDIAQLRLRASVAKGDIVKDDITRQPRQCWHVDWFHVVRWFSEQIVDVLHSAGTFNKYRQEFCEMSNVVAHFPEHTFKSHECPNRNFSIQR